jgi:hypothetical protein
MPNFNLYMPLSAEVASALDNSTVTERFQATPMDVAHPQKSKHHRDDFPSEEHTPSIAAGRLPEDVYTYTLPWWRAALRRKCVAVVEYESEVIGKWQVRLSPPSLREAQTMGGRKNSILSYLCFFVGPCAVALARHVLFVQFDAWHAHVLSHLPSRGFLLWVP